jgi:hypothetical protein
MVMPYTTFLLLGILPHRFHKSQNSDGNHFSTVGTKGSSSCGDIRFKESNQLQACRILRISNVQLKRSWSKPDPLSYSNPPQAGTNFVTFVIPF